MKTVLNSIEGVKKYDVNFEKSLMTVEFDEEKVISSTGALSLSSVPKTLNGQIAPLPSCAYSPKTSLKAPKIT